MHAVLARDIAFSHGARTALTGVSLNVSAGEIFAVVGPNGGGKTTLFRLISTLVPLQQGELQVLGLDVRRQQTAIRQQLGVVFQAPSLDRKLTVEENLRHQGHLYGLSGPWLKSRIDETLDCLGILDRRRDLVQTLSGGLARRAEIAKCLLHKPQLLLMDEPSTGLDPGARHDMWQYLKEVRDSRGVTVLVTTHLLDEAEKADRVAILDAGQLVAVDTPHNLRGSLGGDTITLTGENPQLLAQHIQETLHVSAKVLGDSVRLEQPDAHKLVPQLVETLAGQVQSVTIGRPTLEDVFISRTGHRYWSESSGEAP